MKIIIFSDLHANWEALSALQRAESQPDAILFVGDVVNFGPDPQRCLDWVRANATAAVRGNHDHAVAFGGDAGVNPALLPVFTAHATTPRAFCRPRTGPGWASCRWARASSWTASASTWCTPCPASRWASASRWSRRARKSWRPSWPCWTRGPDLLLVGHTHLPGMRKVGGTVIVNPGSLGQPRNGTPDATYAVWRDGALQIHHLHYDHDTTQRKLMSLPLDPDVVDRLQEILRQAARVSAASGSSQFPRVRPPAGFCLHALNQRRRHPFLLLVGHLREQRQRQHLLRGGLGHGEAAWPEPSER